MYPLKEYDQPEATELSLVEHHCAYTWRATVFSIIIFLQPRVFNDCLNLKHPCIVYRQLTLHPYLVGLTVCLCFDLKFAIKELKELEQWKRDLLKEANALMDFLCEDKDTVKLEECFQIFRDFCLRFNKAVKVRKMYSFHFTEQLFISQNSYQ